MSMDFVRTNKVSERIMDIDVIKDLMIHDLDLTLYSMVPSYLPQENKIMDI